MAPKSNGATSPTPSSDHTVASQNSAVDLPPPDNDDHHLHTNENDTNNNDDMNQYSDICDTSHKSISSSSHEASSTDVAESSPSSRKSTTNIAVATVAAAATISSSSSSQASGWEGWDREEMRLSLGQSYQRHTNVLHDEDKWQSDDISLFGDESVVSTDWSRGDTGERVGSSGSVRRRGMSEVPLTPKRTNIVEGKGGGSDVDDNTDGKDSSNREITQHKSHSVSSVSSSSSSSSSNKHLPNNDDDGEDDNDNEDPYEVVHDQGICPSLKEQDAQVQLAKQRQKQQQQQQQQQQQAPQALFPRSMRRKSIGTVNREKFMNAVKKNDDSDTTPDQKISSKSLTSESKTSTLFSHSAARLVLRQKRVWYVTLVAAVMFMSALFVSLLDGWIQEPRKNMNNNYESTTVLHDHNVDNGDNQKHHDEVVERQRDSRPSGNVNQGHQGHQGKKNIKSNGSHHQMNQHARNIIGMTNSNNENIHSYTSITEASLSNFADVWENIYEGDVPVFWHVPKSGGTTLEHVLMQCLGLVGASRVDGNDVGDQKLQVITHNDSQYINVDLTTPQGIQQAHSNQLIESGLANVILTPQFYQITTLFFDTQQRGRLFCLFRHPVKRAISIFYHMKHATWEPTYHPALAQMTLLDYIQSQYSLPGDDNMVVRTLTNNLDRPLTEQDVVFAKEIVRRKIVVGIMEKFDESMVRFEQYFGWQLNEESEDMSECQLRIIAEGDKRYSHDNYKPETKEFQLLATRNWADVELYHYAKFLFVEQSSLVSTTLA